MSGRFCSAARSVFFIAQAEVLETVPQGGDAQADFEFAREAADERRKIARVSESRILLLLLLQNRHGDFG